MSELVTSKYVISGNIIEVYEYGNGYLKDYKENKGSGRKKGVKSVEYEDNRAKVLQRAKKTLRRRINANANDLNKFVTLTFKENEKDLDYCNYEFKKFIERLKYWCEKKDIIFKYVVVVEFQKRGAVHYHMLCNLPYIRFKELHEIWGNGFVKINRIDRVDNVGAYVVKYMEKDMSDKRLEGRRSFFSSRNLRKPLEITKKEEVQTLASSPLLKDKKPVYQTEFDNEYLGSVTYKQYNLNRK